jgi:F-type H+-transporting ATPase subunit gamma
MASLKELKGRITSVKSTQKITKAKQMVAAAKLRKAQAAAEAARPYAERLGAVMASIASKVSGDSAPKLLAGTGSDQRHLLVVVNTDKGLCGGLNSNLVKAAKAKAAELIAAGKDVQFYLVGKKGRAPIRRDYAKQVGEGFDTSTVRNPGFAEAEAIAAQLVDMFAAGAFDVAHLIFPQFKSALAQDPTVNQLIPVPRMPVVVSAVGYAGREPAPENIQAARLALMSAVEYEPDEESILAELLPRYVKTQLFGALLEREASEQGASMTAMDNATRNAGDLINRLTIEYNRSRQAAITTELVEIISGAEAL